MAPGSENAMVTGEGLTRAFRGVTQLVAKIGSRVFFNVDQGYAGLGSAITNGFGSVFGVRQLLMAIGAGQVNFNGAILAGFIASSTISFIKKTAGVYDTSFIYQLGHAQPSAPQIFAKDAPSVGQRAMSAAVSVKIWRVDEFGIFSLASLVSNVLVLNAQSVIVPFPALDANGQSRWGVAGTKLGLSDLGNHYELPVSIGGEVEETDLATIDGHPRSIEITWTTEDLIGQRLAPDKAFPPVAGQFAGGYSDVLFLDADGIIYVSLPNEIGSFPPSQALFASEPAVAYLSAFGIRLRFGKHSLGVLIYVGGSPALEYQEIWTHLGIKYPQNVTLGFKGRVLVWLGQPAVLDGTALEPDRTYATKVEPDFAGWDEQQTEDMPIVPGFDGRGQYEVWCLGNKVMAQYAPTGKWCSPIDLTGKVSGNIVSAPTVDRQLYLCTSDGAALSLYEFDVGTGSVMIVQTSDIRPNGYEQKINAILAQGSLDNIDHPVKLELIQNNRDAAPVLISNDIRRTPFETGTQEFAVAQPNQFCISHALRMTMESAGGIELEGVRVDCAVQLLETKGPPLNEVATR